METLYQAEYEAILKKELLFRFGTLSSLGSLIYISFAGLDYVVYPEFFFSFLRLRIALSLFLLTLFAISFTKPVQLCLG